jgi:hypothetical protein
MRLLVVGNSHASCLINACRASPPDARLQLDFYVHPGRMAPQVTVREGRLLPARPDFRFRTSVPGAERDGIALASFDAVVVVAMGVIAARNAHLASGLHPLSLASCFGWPVLDAGEGPTPRPISRQMMKALLLEGVMRGGAYAACRDIAAAFAGRVLVEAVPRPSEDVVAPDWALARRYGAATPEVMGEFLGMCDEAFHAALAGLSPRLEALRSPTETLAAGTFLQRAYGREGDPWHANRRFGALMLERLAGQLGV